MDLSDAIFSSWSIRLEPALAIFLASLLYLKGWAKLRRLVPHRFSWVQLIFFEGGLALLFLALFSPLDSFAGLLLEVHMTQHLLLMMVIPSLLLLGHPFLPLLTGLPRSFTRTAIAPILKSSFFRTIARQVTHPVFCWVAYVVVTLGWHLPALYELALRSSRWHRLEHLCFLSTGLLFWWPVIQPWPSRPRWPRWAMIPYLLLADIQNTALSAFLTFYPDVLYPTYALVPRLGDLSAVADQNIAGTIMWVPGSIIFLIPAGLIVLEILSPRNLPKSSTAIPSKPKRSMSRRRSLRPGTRLIQVLRAEIFRRSLQVILLAIALLVIADGFLGPQIGPMNLAGVLPWVHWRGLTVLALLFAGNFFCMSCPFMLVRDIGRRFFPASHAWPRVLRSKWISVALVAIYLWAYEAFNLWNSPFLTAWIVLAYFGAATLIDGWFKGASFCKYICPIGQFHFVQSLTSPTEVRVQDPEVCQTCRTFDCLRGNTTQRGCELQLFQPRKKGNLDCTFCLDCVKACPHTNVGISPSFPGRVLWKDWARSSVGRFSNRPDLAALALVLVFGAFASAAAMATPVSIAINRYSLQSGFLSRQGTLLLFFLLTLVLLPLVLVTGCTLLSKRAGMIAKPFSRVFCSFAMGLVPLGTAMWIAHNCFHLFTASHAFIPVIQRIAADLRITPGIMPAWNIRSWAVPEILDFQILLLDAGLLLALYAFWKISQRIATKPVKAFLPWAALGTSLFIVGLLILFEPMEMRGSFMP